MNLIDLIPKDIMIVKNYKKGEVIFNQGEICNNLCYIISGKIDIYTYTQENNEFHITTLSNGNFFGELLIFNSSDNTYLGNVICLKETKLYIISKKNLETLFRLNHKILLAYIDLISSRAIEIQKRSKILLQQSIREKILFFLNEFKNSNNSVYIDSKENLAKYLNIPRPSLSRELINMSKDNLISFDKHYITLK